MFASIPSPSSGSIKIGPLSIHAYGLMIALGVLAAVWLAGRRLEKAGTGATGWCSSIARQRADAPASPGPGEPAVTWFVREAWPSPATGVTLTSGRLDGTETLELASEGEGLVVFADGLEADRLELSWGQRVTIGVAARKLRLVM